MNYFCIFSPISWIRVYQSLAFGQSQKSPKKIWDKKCQTNRKRIHELVGKRSHWKF